ncbi:hypothetical protein LIER_28536 [Lithospermum erythrorhizon]|uniref:Secreted protein n=1 Tax=Lithospermum erythrorhizon TaxID=34254 RepID=A0AAV3RM05_LITER
MSLRSAFSSSTCFSKSALLLPPASHLAERAGGGIFRVNCRMMRGHILDDNSILSYESSERLRLRRWRVCLPLPPVPGGAQSTLLKTSSS